MDFNRLRAFMNMPTPAPLHLRLSEGIEAQIMDGTLVAGEKLPSERILQQELNISRATVRQAISTLTQRNLLQSIAGTGSFILERQPITVGSGLIGLVVSSPNFHFFYPQLAAAFSQRLQEAGYSIMMSLHNDSTDVFARIEREMLARGIAGMAITPPRHGDLSRIDDLISEMRQAQIPVVFIGRRSERYREIDCVATDNYQIGYQAAKHLIALGHERIIHIGLLDYSTGQDRANGYREAMLEMGLEPQIIEMAEFPIETSSDGSQSEHLAVPAHKAAYKIWKEARPTAAFCFNDITAMGVYKALRELNLRIPQDVSLISVDDLITVRHFEVPLSTFALPGEAIGRQSADLLLRRLAGENFPAQRYLLPAPFIQRASISVPTNHHLQE